jgi:hypothetical protein
MRGGFQVHTPMEAMALVAYALAGSMKARLVGYFTRSRAVPLPVPPRDEHAPTSWLLWRGGPGQGGARAIA